MCERGLHHAVLRAPPPQSLTGHDAVDPIAAARRERHQHHHSRLCGARRIHQRRHHPQLSPGRRRGRRHLRSCRRRSHDEERSRHRRRCFGLCSHSSLFGVYFTRGAALLLSLYLWLYSDSRDPMAERIAGEEERTTLVFDRSMRKMRFCLFSPLWG